MLQVFAALAGALFTLGVAVCLGRVVFRVPGYSLTIQFAAGSALLSAFVFTALWTGFAGRAVFAIAGVVSVALSLAVNRRRPVAALDKTQVPIAAWAVLAAFGVVYVVHALAPEIQPDAIGYHLTLVSEFVRTGTFPERVGFYEMLPQGAEMLFTFAFAFGHHSAAKLVHLGFLFATVPLILRLSRRLELPQWSGALAAALFFCSPLAGLDGSCAYNDAMLAFFTLASLECALGGHGTAAGLCAGFCYGIKLTGGVAMLPVLSILLLRRQWRSTLAALAAAIAIAAPWPVRGALLTGNPLAPFANAWFPNPCFHASMERDILAYVRESAGVPIWQLAAELCWRGELLQGLIGPVFALLPLALLSLRRRGGRIVLAVACVLLAPWLANLGARFLIPALPLLALALAGAVAGLSRHAAVAILVLHGISCWPAAVRLYSSPRAWRFSHTPWAAALRIEPERQYLNRVLWSTQVADLVDKVTRPGALVLDLAALPSAYCHWIPIGNWQSAASERMVRALDQAAHDSQLYDVEIRWPAQNLRALRLRPAVAHPETWAIHEIEFRAGGVDVPPARGWLLDAVPYPSEAPLALDRNLATAWHTWEPADPSMYLEVRFGERPARLDSTRVTVWGVSAAALTAALQSEDGSWRELPADHKVTLRSSVDIRRSAVRTIRADGVRLIVLPESKDFEAITRSMTENQDAWGVHGMGSLYGIHLFAIW